MDEVGGAFFRKKLKFFVTTSNDSKLVARGSKIKGGRSRSSSQAGEETRIRAGVKHSGGGVS